MNQVNFIPSSYLVLVNFVKRMQLDFVFLAQAHIQTSLVHMVQHQHHTQKYKVTVIRLHAV